MCVRQRLATIDGNYEIALTTTEVRHWREESPSFANINPSSTDGDPSLIDYNKRRSRPLAAGLRPVSYLVPPAVDLFLRDGGSTA